MNPFRLVEAAVLDADAGRTARRSTITFAAEFRGESANLKRRQKWSARANATLVVAGSSVSGLFVVDERVYEVSGNCRRLWRDSLTFDLALRDAIDGAGSFSLVGSMRGERLTGKFVGTLPIANLTMIAGAWRAPKLWCQEPPPKHACGALLYEREGITGYPNARGSVRMRIRRYERCVEVEILDPAGRPLNPPRVIHLDEDLNHPVNDNVRVLVYDAPDAGTRMPTSEGGELVRYGEFKFIAVQGCANPHLFQFLRMTVRETPPGGPAGPEGDAKPWAKDDSKLPIAAGPPDGATLWDHPGIPIGFAPRNRPEGTVAVLTYYLETFVCCDGTLLGYVSWGFTLTVTYGQDKAPSTPVVAATPPTWHPPADSPRAAQVNCPL
jgi:hypothetical protein